MNSVVENLRQDGCTKYVTMSENEIDDIQTYFSTKTVYNSHVQVYSTQSLSLCEALVRSGWPMFCHTMEDVVTAPHLFEYATGLHETAKDYFGEKAYLYSMNAFWTQPSHIHYPHTHQWHRDSDCKKQLVMFVYGQSVFAPEQGAHLYQRGSHLKPDDGLGYPMDSPPNTAVERFFGRAGTTFLVDTWGLHMGLKPQSTKRLLLWARWGNDPMPQSYVWDKLSPVSKDLIGDRYPHDRELQEAIHLVVS